MLRYLSARQERFESGQSEWGSGYFAVIQPVGDLVGVITPFATHPVCWNTPRTSPFPQRHRMQVDQFA
jgi:hypothetical protein